MRYSSLSLTSFSTPATLYFRCRFRLHVLRCCRAMPDIFATAWRFARRCFAARYAIWDITRWRCDADADAMLLDAISPDFAIIWLRCHWCFAWCRLHFAAMIIFFDYYCLFSLLLFSIRWYWYYYFHFRHFAFIIFISSIFFFIFLFAAIFIFIFDVDFDAFIYFTLYYFLFAIIFSLFWHYFAIYWYLPLFSPFLFHFDIISRHYAYYFDITPPCLFIFIDFLIYWLDYIAIFIIYFRRYCFLAITLYFHFDWRRHYLLIDAAAFHFFSFLRCLWYCFTILLLMPFIIAFHWCWYFDAFAFHCRHIFDISSFDAAFSSPPISLFSPLFIWFSPLITFSFTILLIFFISFISLIDIYFFFIYAIIFRRHYAFHYDFIIFIFICRHWYWFLYFISLFVYFRHAFYFLLDYCRHWFFISSDRHCFSSFHWCFFFFSFSPLWCCVSFALYYAAFSLRLFRHWFFMPRLIYQHIYIIFFDIIAFIWLIISLLMADYIIFRSRHMPIYVVHVFSFTLIFFTLSSLILLPPYLSSSFHTHYFHCGWFIILRHMPSAAAFRAATCWLYAATIAIDYAHLCEPLHFQIIIIHYYALYYFHFHCHCFIFSSLLLIIFIIWYFFIFIAIDADIIISFHLFHFRYIWFICLYLFILTFLPFIYLMLIFSRFWLFDYAMRLLIIDYHFLFLFADDDFAAFIFAFTPDAISLSMLLMLSYDFDFVFSFFLMLPLRHYFLHCFYWLFHFHDAIDALLYGFDFISSLSFAAIFMLICCCHITLYLILDFHFDSHFCCHVTYFMPFFYILLSWLFFAFTPFHAYWLIDWLFYDWLSISPCFQIRHWFIDYWFIFLIMISAFWLCRHISLFLFFLLSFAIFRCHYYFFAFSSLIFYSFIFCFSFLHFSLLIYFLYLLSYIDYIDFHFCSCYFSYAIHFLLSYAYFFLFHIFFLIFTYQAILSADAFAILLPFLHYCIYTIILLLPLIIFYAFFHADYHYYALYWHAYYIYYIAIIYFRWFHFRWLFRLFSLFDAIYADLRWFSLFSFSIYLISLSFLLRFSVFFTFIFCCWLFWWFTLSLSFTPFYYDLLMPHYFAAFCHLLFAIFFAFFLHFIFYAILLYFYWFFDAFDFHFFDDCFYLPFFFDYYFAIFLYYYLFLISSLPLFIIYLCRCFI